MPGLPGNPIEEKQMHREKSEVGFPAEGSSYGFMTTFLRTLILLAAATGCLATLSCTLGTPQARIDRNTSLYDSLPGSHRELAGQGRIAKGMSQSAVYFALGPPNRKIQGFRDDASFERWDYTRLQPHFHHSFHSYQGLSSHGGHYHGFGFFPAVGYLPYRSASVIFRKEVVDSWERLDPGHFSHRYSH